MQSSLVLGFRARIAHGVEHLFPAYFALVMATGIVSLASFLRGIPVLAWALLGVNVVAYIVLMTLRVALYPSRVLDDLCDHGRGPGFFTLVASTCVLVLHRDDHSGAKAVARGRHQRRVVDRERRDAIGVDSRHSRCCTWR